MSFQIADTECMTTAEDMDSKLICASENIAALTEEMMTVRAATPNRVVLDPDKVEQGLAQLVLTVIELLRQLMERQAMHRVEHGTIDDAAIERLGLAFMRLDERMIELKETFGLRDEDLNIDLGPLGKLM
jgi:CBS-domain-containing membrane protein